MFRRSFTTAWALICYSNHVVLGATSSNLCIIHCMNVLWDVQFYEACMSTFRSFIWSSLTLHLLAFFALLLLTIAFVAALDWSSLRNIIGTWHIRHAKHLKLRRGRYCFIWRYWWISFVRSFVRSLVSACPPILFVLFSPVGKTDTRDKCYLWAYRLV